MRMRTFLLVAAIAALLGISQAANAQYGPMGGPAGPYPGAMGGGGMPGMGMVSAPGGMPGPSPYAPQGLAPAAYAGIGGPAPMGPLPSAPTMSPMGGGMPMQMAPLGMDGGMNGPSPDMYGSPGMPISAGGGDYCPPDQCAGGGWTQKYFGFGEFLYLRPANAEVAYAVPVSSAAAAGGTLVQSGLTRVTDQDYAPSFRAGFGFLLSPRSAIAVTYTQFDRDTFDALSLPGNGSVIRSLVSNPNSITAAGNGLDTAATMQTQFQLLDIDYRGLMVYNPEWQINYVVGARYGNLEQHFAAGFAPATGFEQVLAESEFDGGGLKLGLESLRFHPTTQFFCYGKGYASFLAGTFRTRYEFDSPTQINTGSTLAGFNVGRVVTMLDMEAGVGWQSFTGNLRFSAGYMFSAWLNTVRVNEFINSVQTNNFADPSTNFRGVTTFDGLTTKIELLW